MLILTRREGEALVVGDEIVVTAVGIKGNQIKIGIEAPPEIVVLREELVEPGTLPMTRRGRSD